jgi:hypothetical protein
MFKTKQSDDLLSAQDSYIIISSAGWEGEHFACHRSVSNYCFGLMWLVAIFPLAVYSLRYYSCLSMA